MTKKFLFFIIATNYIFTFIQCSNEITDKTGKTKKSEIYKEFLNLNIKFNVANFIYNDGYTINNSAVSISGEGGNFQEELTYNDEDKSISCIVDNIQYDVYSIELTIIADSTITFKGRVENLSVQKNIKENMIILLSDVNNEDETVELLVQIDDNTITPPTPPDIEDDEIPVLEIGTYPQVTLLYKEDHKYDVYYTFSEDQYQALNLENDNIYAYVDCVVRDIDGRALSDYGCVQAYDNDTIVDDATIWLTECDLGLVTGINYYIESFFYTLQGENAENSDTVYYRKDFSYGDLTDETTFTLSVLD